MEVLLVEDDTRDEFAELLHEIALAAMALRAVSPGDPRTDELTSTRPEDLVPPWPRRVRRWGAAAIALLVAAAVAVAVVDARGAAAAAARLAADPTVLSAMTGPPVVQWETAGPGAPRDLDSGARAGTTERTLDDGTLVTWSRAPDGSFERGRVDLRRGARAYALPGAPLLPEVTDGSVPRTLVIVTREGSRLRGLALVTGSRLWSLPRAGTGPVRAVAQVDGVLVLDEGSVLTTVDVRTGDPLWSTSVAPEVTGQGRTDGDRVLLVVREDDGSLLLVARSLADGAEVWRTALPTTTTQLDVVDHQLVVTTTGTTPRPAGGRADRRPQPRR